MLHVTAWTVNDKASKGIFFKSPSLSKKVAASEKKFFILFKMQAMATLDNSKVKPDHVIQQR